MEPDFLTSKSPSMVATGLPHHWVPAKCCGPRHTAGSGQLAHRAPRLGGTWKPSGRGPGEPGGV